MTKPLRFITGLFGKSSKSQTTPPAEAPAELYNTFNPSNHLLPSFDKEQFDTLHGWDFGWAVVQSIQSTTSTEQEKLLSTRLSPGQKAFYFIWYLDGEVTNGGFIQFYWNGNGKYLPPILEGLKFIGETITLNLVEQADEEFKSNIHQFIQARQQDDWEPLYNDLKKFDALDTAYYAARDAMMQKMEDYARTNPHEFFIFTT